jgi:asparagine synthase (glutamine-hydrolysing)
VVLTGEGADEVFGGYDLFKEAKVRRFCAAPARLAVAPHLLFKRLYPYLDLNQRTGTPAYLELLRQGLDAPDRRCSPTCRAGPPLAASPGLLQPGLCAPR